VAFGKFSLTALVYAGDISTAFESGSIDVTNVPCHLNSMRTMFTGLHRFRPEVARLILEDTVKKGNPIGGFEFP